jgi:hypothetical protein
MGLNKLIKDFRETANDIYYCGMLKYESICEKFLMKTDLSDELKYLFQEEVLDKAQIFFEQNFLDKERSE